MRIAYLLRQVSCVAVALSLLAIATDSRAQTEPRPPRKGSKYKVRIDSAPQQAAIYLDDEKYGIVGYTPWSGSLQRGQWKIIVKKQGYEDATRVVDIKRTRKTQDFFLPMVKKDEPAVIEVRADADRNAFDAEVWVDGQLQGKIPATLKMSPGRFLVEVKKKDHETFTQWVEVKEGERVTVNPMLKQNATGSILVEADVGAAELYIDGNRHADMTPSLVSGVLAGPHIIEVRKAPAMPWRQTVQVVAGETVKVSAQLKATMGGEGGNIRVLSNVDGAEVYLDGTKMGLVPLDLKAIKPGDHLIELRAPGHMAKEERVTVAAGSALVLKLDLTAGPSGATGMLKILSPVPEAVVFIDGEKIGKVPQERAVSTGEHFVVVSKAGRQSFKKKIVVEQGKTVTLTAELKAAGALRLVSNPSNAEVFIDGELAGRTPMVTEDIGTGDHVVSIKAEGFRDFEKTVTIKGGKTEVVNAKLEDSGPTEEELAKEQKGLTSFGARTLPRGRSTIDFASGYPYYLDARINVGAGKISDNVGLDAGFMFRSYFSRTDLGINARLSFIDQEPFSLGIFGDIGGGSNFIDDTMRRGFFADAGGAASLSGLGAVTVTLRGYFNFWWDRHCPSYDPAAGTFDAETDPLDICEDYANGTIDPADKAKIDKILGGDGEIFKGDVGARFMASVIIEIAIKQRWNMWLLFEGAPFQGERAAFTDFFYAPQLEEDVRSYFRLGFTYKF